MKKCERYKLIGNIIHMVLTSESRQEAAGKVADVLFAEIPVEE